MNPGDLLKFYVPVVIQGSDTIYAVDQNARQRVDLKDVSVMLYLDDPAAGIIRTLATLHTGEHKILWVLKEILENPPC